ncbi:MAG: D-alanyl-D-alanine carboxypeptidase [Clostridia bacterium]|nr:D-alanyl-D-alanine carboxypeptidase [Clostridia bacterium]
MKNLLTRSPILVLIILLLSSSLPLNAAEPVQDVPPEIGAEFAVIFNADDEGEILYGKNENLPVYCGFLPRVMTCLLIAECGRDLNETVTITKEILVNTPQISNVKLSVGETVSLKDLIACITIANSQEAAVAAAIHLEGSLAEFVKKMNQKAIALGCKNTLFTNVTGKHVSNTRQISTLADCAKIISAALQYPEIADTAAERSYKITVKGKNRTIFTRNMLIETTSSYYNTAAKGLFIYSETASNSSIATYRKDSDRKIISMAVTNNGLGELYEDAGILLQYSKNRYVMKTLLSEGKAMAEVKVNNGKDVDFAVLVSESAINAFVPKIYSEDTVELLFDIPQTEVDAPVEKGTVMGYVTVRCGGKDYGTVALKVQAGVELDYFELYSSKVVTFFSNPILWAILGGLLLLVIGYTFLAYQINKPRKKRKTPASETGGRIRMTGTVEEDDE